MKNQLPFYWGCQRHVQTTIPMTANLTIYNETNHPELNLRVLTVEQKKVKFTYTTKLDLGGEISRVRYRVVPGEDYHGKFNGIVIVSIDGDKPTPGLRDAAIELLEPIHNGLYKSDETEEFRNYEI